MNSSERASAFRVGLSCRLSSREGVERHCVVHKTCQRRIRLKRDIETTGIPYLRNKEDISQSRRIAENKVPYPAVRSELLLERLESRSYPVAIPFCLLGVRHADLFGQVLQNAQVVDWVDLTGDL